MKLTSFRWWFQDRFPGLEQALKDQHLIEVKRVFRHCHTTIGQLFEIKEHDTIGYHRPSQAEGTKHIVQGETVYEVLQKLSNSYSGRNYPIKERTPEELGKDYLEQMILQGATLETFRLPPQYAIKGRAVTSLVVDRDGGIEDSTAWNTFGRCYRTYRHKP